MYNTATLANIVVKVPTLFFLFFSFYAYCVIFKSVSKSALALFRPMDLEKTQTRQYSSRENYYKLTSGRNTELKL